MSFMDKRYPLKLSVVVPVYNAERYLERCVGSILHQDIDKAEYEIILINDGSTDRSYEIAKKLKDNQGNIILISQENQGQSVARNRGIEVATGKYIMFVDSDDYIENNSIGEIIKTAEDNQLDICLFQAKIEDESGKCRLGSMKPYEYYRIYSGEELLLSGYSVSAVWNCIYSAALIRSTKMLFYSGIFHEDVEFNLRLYPLAKKIMITGVYCYHYFIYNDSSSNTNNPQKIEKGIVSDFYVARNIKEAIKKKQYSSRINTFFIEQANTIMISTLLYLLKDKRINKKQKNKCLDIAKEIGVYPITGRTKSWKTAIMKICFNNELFFRKIM